MKKCSKCLKTKPTIEFYADRSRKRGMQSWCKLCHASHNKTTERQAANKRYQKKANKRYLRTDRGRATVKRLRQTDQGRSTMARAMKNYRKTHPETIRAINAVAYAARSGRIPIVANLACSECGERAEQYHHAKGYDSKHAFEVVPLCYPCHLKAHGKERNA